MGLKRLAGIIAGGVAGAAVGKGALGALGGYLGIDLIGDKKKNKAVGGVVKSGASRASSILNENRYGKHGGY